MNRLSTLVLSTMALLFLGIGLPASNAVAQQKSLKEQLVGTWTFVSAVNTRPDGTKFDPFDGRATGVLMSDSTGHFSWQIIRSDIPKLASNNRLQGTADEFKAVAQGIKGPLASVSSCRPRCSTREFSSPANSSHRSSTSST